MKTLAESWACRLAELRAICRENGERLNSDLRSGFERDHACTWWASFCDAAERGEELAPKIWRSAERLGQARAMAGWVTRLRIRNEIQRSTLKPGV